MKSTLAQIRAANALDASKVPGIGEGKQGGDSISGFPMLIKQCGLLPALAFAIEEKKDQSGQIVPKHKGAFAIATKLSDHLKHAGIGIYKPGQTSGAKDLTRFVAGSDAGTLRRATAEAIAWLTFLKRFVA